MRAALDVLSESRYQRVIILGDPGSGKSTLARYVLLSLIDTAGDEKLRKAFEGHLPLLIELRVYAGLCADKKCKTFLEFLEYLGETEGWHLTKNALHQHLKNAGRAVVIFDGLDEIFDPEERERITRQIVGFASDYPKARIIATSRIIGYRRKVLADSDFAHFTLQDLDESQVAAFVSRWYDLALSDRPEEAKERRERILRSFKESASIRQLAGNPMLLTIMAIISKHQELPRERWKLYDHAASVLIEHWDVNRHLKDQSVQADFIGQDEKKEMLRRLAFKMQSGAGGLAGNYIHQTELQAEFESYLKERYQQSADRAVVISRAIIAQFRERNFILSLYGATLYGFVHRAFLEFFCASAFVKKFEKSQDMSLEQLKREAYGAHWQDRSWHEVLRLICGMIDEKFAGEIIDCLINVTDRPNLEKYSEKPLRHIVLAVQCLSELKNMTSVAEPAGRLLEAIHSVFCRITGDATSELNLTLAIYVELLPAIKLIGPGWPSRERLIDWIEKKKLSTIKPLNRSAFGQFIGLIGAGLDEAYQILTSYLIDGENRGDIAISAIVTGWRGKPQTLSLLQKCAVKSQNILIRSTALQALADYFLDDPQSFSIIRDRAISDNDGRIRSIALRRLYRNFHSNSETLSLMRERAVSDTDENVRSKAKQLADLLSRNVEDIERGF